MLKGLLAQQLLKAAVVVLIGLVLFGVSTGESFAAILCLFAISRLISLTAEAIRNFRLRTRESVREADWSHRRLEPEPLPEVHGTRGFGPNSQSAAVAAECVEGQMAAPPRGKLEIGAEILGVLGFVLILPALIALETHDFYSLRMRHGWLGAAVVMGVLCLYLWPFSWAKSPSGRIRSALWWALPFVPLCSLFLSSIEIRHPYLDPFRSDHARLAADRVLALQDNILAGSHADWVMRYARRLDKEGDAKQATHYYREALRLDPNDQDARARLAVLETSPENPGNRNAATGPLLTASAPYWSPHQAMNRAPRIKIDAALENVNGCTVILVPVGEVPDHLLDSVAYTIEHELSLPVFVRAELVPQPEHTRIRGLLIGKQWEVTALFRSFIASCEPFPHGPLRYILLAPADIYMGEANYVFSATSDWGAVVSFARFGAPEAGSLCLHRTAKQCLCALLKSYLAFVFRRIAVASPAIPEVSMNSIARVIAPARQRWHNFRERLRKSTPAGGNSRRDHIPNDATTHKPSRMA